MDAYTPAPQQESWRRRVPWLAAIASVVAGAPLFFSMPPLLACAAMVGVGVAPLAALFAFRQPFLLCLVFVLFSFFRIHEAFPALGVLHIPQLTAAPTIMVLLWRVLGTRTVDPFWTRELTALGIFFTLVTLGVIFAVSRPTALAYWSSTYIKIFAMVIVIAWMTRQPRDFALASHAIVMAGVLIALVALYNKANGIGLVEGTRVTIARDLRSVLGDPNDLSLVLLFPLSFAVSLVAVRGKLLSVALGAIATAAILCAIVATQSRGGLMGSAAVLGIFGSRVIKSKALLLAIGIVALLALFAVAGISGRSSGGAGEAGIDESSMGRIYAWGAAWRMALARPLTGVGIDNFTSNYFFYSAHWDGLNHAVHSTWFGVLGETGFPGIAAFFSMVALTIGSCIRSARETRSAQTPTSVRQMALALLSGIVAFCVAGTFLTQGFTWPLYILVALCAATSQFAKANLRNATMQTLDNASERGKSRNYAPC